MNQRSDFRNAIEQLPREDPPPTRTATADHGGIAICGDHVNISVPLPARTSSSLGLYCATGITLGVALALLGAWMLGVPMTQVPLYCTVWIGFLTGLTTAIVIWRKERSPQT